MDKGSSKLIIKFMFNVGVKIYINANESAYRQYRLCVAQYIFYDISIINIR